MVEIEFLSPAPDGPEPPVRPDEAPRRGAQPGDLLRWAAPVLWTVAAALVLIAPFRMLYRLSIHAFASSETEQFDGWGRISQPQAGFAEHGPRYGLLLCVVVGLFLIAAGASAMHAAASSAAPRWRRPPLRLTATGTGLAGLGLLVGTLGAALIDVQSISNNIDAQLAAPSDDESVVNSPANPSAQLDLGGAVWLSVAAFVLAVAALAITAAHARRTAGTVVGAPAGTPAPEAVALLPAADQSPLPIDTALDSSLQPMAPPFDGSFVTHDPDDDLLR